MFTFSFQLSTFLMACEEQCSRSFMKAHARTLGVLLASSCGVLPASCWRGGGPLINFPDSRSLFTKWTISSYTRFLAGWLAPRNCASRLGAVAIFIKTYCFMQARRHFDSAPRNCASRLGAALSFSKPSVSCRRDSTLFCLTKRKDPN